MTGKSRKTCKEIIEHIINGEMRFLDLMELGVEATQEMDAFYELQNKKSPEKLRKARSIFVRGYKMLRKLYYNV